MPKNKCEVCNILKEERSFLREEIKFLRTQNKRLLDNQILKSAQLDSEYVGGGEDQYIAYDEFGQKILVEKDLNLEANEGTL